MSTARRAAEVCASRAARRSAPTRPSCRARRSRHTGNSSRREMGQIELFYLAHSRTGDKGDSQTMSLIPYRPEDYALIEREVTGEAVKNHFGKLTRGSVTRYALPNLGAFNFVLEETLQGGVNDSLNLD